MKEISLEELKDIQARMTKQVHDFCEENGLRYYVFYGTLIGAIRHKGYIPWDDDIDLAMPRPDYDRFLKTFNGAYPDLEVLAPELDPGFYAPYANVCLKGTRLVEQNRRHHGREMGVKIDIFPIDGAPEDDAEYANLRKRLLRLKFLLFYKNVALSRYKDDKVLWIKTLAWKIMLLPLSVRAIQHHIHRLAVANDFETSKYSDELVFISIYSKRLPKRVYANCIDVDFEGYRLKAPRDYDEFLRSIYGDYMQLPPEAERNPYHGFRAYWL